MNITSFGLPEAAYDYPVAAGSSTGWNLFTWCVIAVIADGKMRAIFSLAFGASVYLLIDRLSRRGAATDAADIHYRRMLWLLLFGMIHAYFIWGGDILFIYGMLGLLLYPLRKLSPRALVIGAAALMLGLSAFSAYQYFHCVNLHGEYDQIQREERAGKKLTADQEDKKKEWEDTISPYYPSADDLKKETGAHLGSYFQLFAFRAKGVYSYHSHPLYYPWVWYDPMIMMLIGMALLKLGVLTDSYSKKFYVWMPMLSFAVGLPAHLWTVWWPIWQHFSVDAWFSLAVRSGVFRSATKTLACVGRMAFSNYILTSLICTTIFEGYGFGLFGKFQRYQLYGIVLFEGHGDIDQRIVVYKLELFCLPHRSSIFCWLAPNALARSTMCADYFSAKPGISL
jgi:uncharacterized protein